MVIIDQPDLAFTYKSNIFSTDALEFIAELETLAPETVVGYLSGKLEATRGVWLRVGNYRLADGSFIDPSDLMLYVEQYYKPEDGGPICALELNHGKETPDDALAATTLDELLDALVRLDLEDGQNVEESADDEQNEAASSDGKLETEAEAPAEEPLPLTALSSESNEQLAHDPEFASEAENGADAEAQASDKPEETLPPSRFEGMTIIEPSGAFEMHGALTKGWHAMYYEAADGSALLAFE